MSRLNEIFEHKRSEVAAAKALLPESELEAIARSMPPTKGFLRALTGHPDLALIAEVKKASPSMGTIRGDLDPVATARTYESAGAQCLSVLTDVKYFSGSPEYLKQIRRAVSIPLLRKDFVDDPYQILEARAWGADAILLIVASLSPTQVSELSAFAKDLDLDVLVEVHTVAEAELALELSCDLIGVNNRDLSTFQTRLETSDTILPMLIGHAVAVSESALETRADLDRVKKAGANAVLIGTTFCSAPDIGAKVHEVMAR